MKQNKFSILQISDLHKMEGAQYGDLLQKLLDDKIRMAGEGILPPSFVVVCGDVIQGAKTEQEIRDQYTEVESFLNGLVNHYLGGDKHRMIIVPGNHDMNRVASEASFSDSKKAQEEDYKEYRQHNSDLRWNWKKHKYQRVQDKSKYDSRFGLFIEFYNRFFYGIRSYPADPVMEPYTVFFPKENVAFACFNSCCGLDHINTSACIPEDVLDSIAPSLNRYRNDGYLTIGVWHHHYYGSPYQVNYLDKAIFDKMIRYGIGLGLFGHQHLSQVATEITNLYVQDDDELYRLKRMLLISSGTLFGGSRELPDGCRRQYNVIELDMRNGEADVTVHIREDMNPNINSPLPHWVRKEVNQQGKVINHLFFKHLSENEILVNIDHYVRLTGDYPYGCTAVKDLPQMTTRAMEMYREYLNEVKDYDTLVSVMGEPDGAPDYILLMASAKRDGNTEAMKKLVSDAKLIALCASDEYLKEKYEEMEDLIG